MAWDAVPGAGFSYEDRLAQDVLEQARRHRMLRDMGPRS